MRYRHDRYTQDCMLTLHAAQLSTLNQVAASSVKHTSAASAWAALVATLKWLSYLVHCSTTDFASQHAPAHVTVALPQFANACRSDRVPY